MFFITLYNIQKYEPVNIVFHILSYYQQNLTSQLRYKNLFLYGCKVTKKLSHDSMAQGPLLLDCFQNRSYKTKLKFKLKENNFDKLQLNIQF